MAQIIKIAPSTDPYIGSLEWGGYVWSAGGTAHRPVHLTYYLDETDADWNAIEAKSVADALQSYANVSNISFSVASSAATANLIEHSVPSADLGGAYGEHGVPEDANQTAPQYDGALLLSTRGHAHGYFNHDAFGWDSNDRYGGLSIGGNGYWTLVHELGHGLGLAHPHDDGGGSGIFPGVDDEGDTGDNGLNQSAWTVMTYVATQDASSAHTEGEGDDLVHDAQGHDIGNYGYVGGPMAFDIAAIQNLYGANATYHNTNNTYVLPDRNAVGTYWSCIWDTGGTDGITYGGRRNVTIDLTAATLDDSATGGGVISAADGIHGGYTIAHGVVIENATGGSGNDSLKGNRAANALNGGGGNDTLDGGSAGADRLSGGLGDDTYIVSHAGMTVVEGANAGTDTVKASIGFTLRGGVENLVLTGSGDIGGIGTNAVNEITGNAGSNSLNGGGSADVMTGGAGNDTYYVDDAGDQIVELAGGGTGDTVRAQASHTLAANVEILRLINDNANIAGIGNGLDNTISGSAGSNIITGLGGRDVLTGAAGRDVFTYKALSDSTVSSTGRDTITDFTQSQIDRIDLHLIDANSAVAGDQGFAFIGSAAFSHKAGELHYAASGASTLVSGDVNGDGVADFSILLSGSVALARSDFLL